MNNLKNRVKKIIGKRHSVQRKFVIIYFTATVVPVLCIMIFTGFLYYLNMSNIVNTLVIENMNQYEMLTNEKIDSYKKILYGLAADNDFIKLATEVNKSNNDDFLVYDEQIRQILSTNVFANNDITSIMFLSNNGEKYSQYNRWYSNQYNYLWSDDENRNELYNKIVNEDDVTYIAPIEIIQNNEKEYIIIIGFPIKNLHTKEVLGAVALSIDTDSLFYENSSYNNKLEGITTIIVDENNKIISGVDYEFLGQDFDSYVQEEYKSTSNIVIVDKSIESCEWNLIDLVDKTFFYRYMYGLIFVFFILIIFIIILFFLLLLFMTKNYFMIINRISNLISGYDGDIEKEIELEIDKHNELYIISNQLNSMTLRINSLIDTLKRKNSEIEIALTLQRKAEIKALEAQINPHFLYNTLDSINWRAIDHDEIEISNMLSQLGSLLRYSVSNIDTLVFLEAEIIWLKKYIFLQNQRFNQSFHFEYDVSQKALEFPLYKMILQPIIENIILHAFEGINGDKIIYVKSFVRSDSKLQVIVKDNGKGIKEDVLIDIKNKINSNSYSDSDSIGINNVINRLRIYYQDEFELYVESEIGKGTMFNLIIPKTYV